MPVSVVFITVGLSGPQRISRCSPLYIDSSATKLINNKCLNIKYTWSFTSVPELPSHFANITMNSLNKSRDILSIDDELTPGYTYNFTLTIITPFGSSTSGSIVVQKLSDAVPTVTIGGTQVQNVLPSKYTSFIGSGLIPRCLNGSSINFRWEQTFGDAISLNPVLRQTNTMTLSPFSIVPFRKYGLRLMGCIPLREGTNACSYADLEIEGISSGLRPLIVGGTAGVAGCVRDFVMDASISFDPEVQTQDDRSITYQWNCKNLTSLLPCSYATNSSEIVFPNRGVIIIKQSGEVPTLNPGSYIFTVTVSKSTGAYIPAVASKTMEILDQDPPAVSLLPLDQEYPSVASTLRLSGYATYSTGNVLSYSWKISGGASSFEELGLRTADLKYPRLSIPPNRLKDNTEYTITLIATDTIRSVRGKSEVTFKTNALPFGGIFECPSNGGEQLSAFLFEAKGWQTFDFNYPLSYAFGYVLSDDGFDQIVSSYAPYSTRTIIMPEGKMSGAAPGMTLLKAVLYISDINGNSIRLEKYVNVTSLKFTDDSERASSADAIVSDQMNSALELGNYDLVTQYCASCMDIINSLSSEQNQRLSKASQQAPCTLAQIIASSTRLKAFYLMKTTNSKQQFYTATQTDANIQLFSSILGDSCLNYTLIANASMYLSELAESAKSTSVLPNTGNSLLNAFTNLFNSALRLPKDYQVGPASPKNILFRAQGSAKQIARSSINFQLCGDTGYAASSKLLQIASYKQCSDAEPILIIIPAIGSPGIVLSREVYSNQSDPVLHASNTDYNFYTYDPDAGSTLLDASLESSDYNAGIIMIRNLRAPVYISLPRSNPNNLDLKYHIPTCVSYNFTSQMWTKDGCQRVSYDDQQIICKCYMLSTFASSLEEYIPTLRYNKSMSYGMPHKSMPNFKSKTISNAIIRSRARTEAFKNSEPQMNSPTHKFSTSDDSGLSGGKLAMVIGGTIAVIGAVLMTLASLIYKRNKGRRVIVVEEHGVSDRVSDSPFGSSSNQESDNHLQIVVGDGSSGRKKSKSISLPHFYRAAPFPSFLTDSELDIENSA